MQVRHEQARDRQQVLDLNRRAFPSDFEARLIEAIRSDASDLISLVAEEDGHIVGHVLFTAVRIGQAARPAVALGPMAVDPDHQRHGIGSALVESGLDACRQGGHRAVFVLGHPEYYPRFGFEPAGTRGLFYVSEAYAPAFFVLELVEGGLTGMEGEVDYHPAFGAPGD